MDQADLEGTDEVARQGTGEPRESTHDHSAGHRSSGVGAAEGGRAAENRTDPARQEPLPGELEPGEVDEKRPWPGLHAFRDSALAARYFCGRERDKRELLRLISRDESLVVLYGISGLGKTSLLRAGCFRSLARGGCFPIYIRFNFKARPLDLRAQVLDKIAAAAAEQKVEAPAVVDEEISFWQYFHQPGSEFWSRLNRLLVPVLVFDQFEEVFTLGSRTPDARRAVETFLGELTSLVNNDPPQVLRRAWDRLERPADFRWGRGRVKVVLSLREDFLGDLERLRDTLPAVMQNRLRLEPMSGEQALEVVLEPVPGLVDEEVARRIVRFVGREKHRMEPAGEEVDLADLRVEPALLSFLCAKLNDLRLDEELDKIEPDLLEHAEVIYEEVDSEQPLELRILEKFYHDCFAGLPAAARELVEDRLLTGDGYRDWASYHDLEQALGERESLDSLIEGRLLRVEERAGTRRVELIHDVLTPIVKTARDRRRERDAYEEQLRRAEEETAHRQQEERRRWAEEQAECERELRERAEKQSQRAKTWMWGAIAALVVALLSLFGVMGNLFEELGQVEHKQRRSEVLRLVAEARLATGESAEFGALLAREAHAQARKGGEGRPLVRRLRRLGFGATGSALDRDVLRRADQALRDALDRWPDQLLALHDPNDLPSGAPSSGDLSVAAIALDDNGRWLLTGSGTGYAWLWDLAAEDTALHLRPAAVWRAAEEPLSAVAFSPDGERLAVAGGGTIRLWRRPALLANRHEPETEWKAEEPGEVEPIYQLALGDESSWLEQERGLRALTWWVAERAVALRPIPEAAHFQAASADLGWLVVTTDTELLYWRLGAGEDSARSLRPHLEVVPLYVGPGRFAADGPGLLVGRLREAGHKAVLTVLGRDGRPGEPFEVTKAPDELRYARLSADLDRLVTGTERGEVGLWSLTGNGPARRLSGRLEGVITAAALSADGSWLAVGTTTGQIGLWEDAAGAPSFCGILNGADQRIFFGGAAQEPIRFLEFLDSERLLSAAGSEFRVGAVAELCRAAAGTTSLLRRYPPKRAVAELGISLDGRWLAAGFSDGAFRLWQLGEVGSADLESPVDSENPVEPPPMLESGRQRLVFGPPRWLVTGPAEPWGAAMGLQPIRLIDLDAGPEVVPLSEQDDQSQLRNAAFDPQGRWLAVATWRESTESGRSVDASAIKAHLPPGVEVRIWLFDLEAAPPARLGQLEVLPDHDVETLLFSPTGDRLFAGGSGRGSGVLCDWPIAEVVHGHADPEQACRKIAGDRSSITALLFDDDGKEGLYAGQDNGRILRFALERFGRPETSEEIAQLQGPISLLALTGDRRYLIAADNWGSAWRQERADPANVARFSAIFGEGGVAFCVGGRTLAISGGDRTIHVFDASADDPKATRVVLHGDGSAITDLALRCGAQQLFAATARGIHRFELDSARLLERAERLRGLSDAERQIYLETDGRL